ncbi:DUF1449 family protein [Flammeovirga yaeyamensis]|uniref:DUF1449 family protein n=1 Tax=Flammeovirga yaeyamensis TaxID=367791 RepID=A0AAX1N3J0_9BACT|nr:OB-fold-containig protein [Flammeovirga yaeyamensis]MBB3700690.1 hypothetical protein [Flammeovirga yaeyamensis]NMF37802.1 YqiJ family protein [Flammeovirga yaeyamensis]QWG02109.1 DUF1449 family protein [Flammeovirga yaeyamensis]
MELLNESIKLINLPYTFLLILCIIYWLNVIIGAITPDFLDVQLDLDNDIDLDVDTDLDTDVSSVGIFQGVLQFLHVGIVPVMLIFTVLFTLMWLFSILFNHYIFELSPLMALGTAIPNIVLSIFLTRYIAFPFASLFRKLNEEEDREIIGKRGKVLLGASESHKGQISIWVGSGEQKVYIKSSDGLPIEKGEEAIVVEYDTDQKCYLVQTL